MKHNHRALRRHRSTAALYPGKTAALTMLAGPLLGLGAILPAANAAEDTATADEPVQLDTVVVTGTVPDGYTVNDSAAATKLPLSLRETPQSVTVITRERLEDQNLQSLRDVLDITPGIYSYAYDSERVVFTARGFPIDNLLYDGLPATTNFNTDSLDETIDTALYDRIEIVRGATGLMTGAGSPAASVNLIRKHADSTAFSGQAEATVGRWDNRRFVGDVSTPLTANGKVRARLVGVYQYNESYQNLYRKEKQAFYGVIDADLTPHTLLSIGYDYQTNLPQSNTWGSFPLYFSNGQPTDWPRSVTTATDWSYWNKRKETVFGELKHQFDNGWSLHSALSWRMFHENYRLFYLDGFPDQQTGEGLTPYVYRASSKIAEIAADLNATGPFRLFGRQHELVVGYNGSHVRNTGTEYDHGDLADPGNFYNWDGSYPQPDYAPGIRLQDVNTRQNGVYTAARFTLADPLKLIAGARYSTWKIGSFYIYDSPDVTFEHDYTKVIPYGGLTYDFSKTWTAFTSYTEIFKPQNARDVEGKYLDPISGRSYEAGIKGEPFRGRLNTALTVFETRQSNVAAPAYDADGTAILLPDGTQASTAVPGTRTRGFEFEATGAVQKGWNVSLGWTRNLIQDQDGNAIRTFIPATLIRSFTTWTPGGAWRDLTIGGGVNWQSSSSTTVPSPSGGTLQHQGDVTLVGLMARYALTKAVSLQANANNLLDQKYYVLDEYGNSYFGSPVDYAVSLNLRF